MPPHKALTVLRPAAPRPPAPSANTRRYALLFPPPPPNIAVGHEGREEPLAAPPAQPLRTAYPRGSAAPTLRGSARSLRGGWGGRSSPRASCRRAGPSRAVPSRAGQPTRGKTEGGGCAEVARSRCGAALSVRSRGDGANTAQSFSPSSRVMEGPLPRVDLVPEGLGFIYLLLKMAVGINAAVLSSWGFRAASHICCTSLRGVTFLRSYLVSP